MSRLRDGLAQLRTLREVVQHPLNRGHAARALARWARWHLGSRLVPGPVAVPFVGRTRLLVEPGMTGATGNVYMGLHELEPMGFALHLLRPGDAFVDVGANVGSYTVLASGAAGARTLAYEPVPSTFARLERNVRLNGLEALVRARNAAVGAGPGRLSFSSARDTTNRALVDGERAEDGIDVEVVRLDDEVAARDATLLKVDVEGFEGAVLQGATELLQRPALLAITIELIGQGARYGHDEDALRARLRALGFVEHRYDPLTRTLSPATPRPTTELFVRDVERVRERLRSAPRFRVLDRDV